MIEHRRMGALKFLMNNKSIRIPYPLREELNLKSQGYDQEEINSLGLIP